MDGRFFGGTKITARISDAKGDKFKMTPTKGDDEEAQRKRQEAYGRWLEQQDDEQDGVVQEEQ